MHHVVCVEVNATRSRLDEEVDDAAHENAPQLVEVGAVGREPQQPPHAGGVPRSLGLVNEQQSDPQGAVVVLAESFVLDQQVEDFVHLATAARLDLLPAESQDFFPAGAVILGEFIHPLLVRFVDSGPGHYVHLPISM